PAADRARQRDAVGERQVDLGLLAGLDRARSDLDRVGADLHLAERGSAAVLMLLAGVAGGMVVAVTCGLQVRLLMPARGEDDGGEQTDAQFQLHCSSLLGG